MYHILKPTNRPAGTYLERRSSLSTWITIRVILTDIKQNGKSCKRRSPSEKYLFSPINLKQEPSNFILAIDVDQNQNPTPKLGSELGFCICASLQRFREPF